MVVKHGDPGNKIALQRFSPLYLISNTPKGRGVYAGREISSGTTIDVCAVLVLDPTENTEHVGKTNLYNYTYNWPSIRPNGTSTKTQAVVFGLGSMFNHSSEDQNVGWMRDLENELVVYRAVRDIREGEELCISYGDSLTFVDVDAPSRKDDNEVAEDLLAKFDLA